jgi:capsular exopolysaccharide synthesis family protein
LIDAQQAHDFGGSAGQERSAFNGIRRAVRRGGVWVVAATLLGGAGTFGVSKVLPAEYQATAQLYLTPASTSTALFQDVVLGANLAKGYVQLATAEVVLRPAMTAVNWHDLKTFRERTDVAQVKDTPVINVSFKDGDPERAAVAANAIAKSFIDQSKSLQSTLQGTTADQLDEQARSIQREIVPLEGQIAIIRAALAAPGVLPNRTELQAQLAQLDSSLASKQQTLAQLVRAGSDIRLATARGENSISLWQPAVATNEPVSPRVGANTLIGALAAALIAILAVGMLMYLDDRMSDVDDLRNRLNVAALGEIARGKRPDDRTGKLFVRDEPTSIEAEDFRSLRTNISFANVDHRPQTILVTSAMPLEGKSVVSANLALAFAQAGTPTILIDADLRRPSQHKLFKIRADSGLIDLLAGDGPLTANPGTLVAPGLIVIPVGSIPPNPAEILASVKMTTLLNQLLRQAEGTVIIIDSSPVLPVTDAAALAPKVDGCLLVVDSGRTQARSAQRAIDALRAVHAVIFGAVLNKVALPQTSYYYPQAEAELVGAATPE